jgi:multidrug efflux pump subunit AcrB
MFVSDTAVEHRITVFVLTALIVLAGLQAYFSLPREAAPEVVIPNVFVSTSYRGVSPEDMETSVTKEIEEKLKGLENVKKISSVSAEGRSEINVEFVTGTDIDDAVQKVKDKVDEAGPELPADLDDEPQVDDINFSEMPVFIFAVSGPVGPRELREIADDLEETLEGLPGVLEVDVAGGLQREIHVEVDPHRMVYYGVPFRLLGQVVRSENANVSGGSITTSEGKYQIRLEGEFESVGEVESIVLTMLGDGSPVYLRDVGRVVDGFKDQHTASRLDGEEAVTLYVRKRSGENIIEIVEACEAAIAEERLSWPPGVTMTRLVNRADDIRLMIEDLENNIITGLLLVILVVCIAMGLRNAVLVSLSIPLSMLLGFVILNALGITLNMVVLFALTLALGMLVDNAVVIIENIYRFMQEGVPRLEAAMRATSEVAYPIIGSGLTTIAAFTPLLFWPGVMGDFMFYLPATVVTVLASCLFVALVINPALAAVLMRAESADGATRSADEITAGGDHPMLHQGGVIIRTYRRILAAALGTGLQGLAPGPRRRERLLKHLAPILPRLAVLGIALLFMVFVMHLWMLRVGVQTPTEFFPSVDPDRAQVTLRMPEGADLTYCSAVIRDVERRVFDRRTFGPAGAERLGAIEEALAAEHRGAPDAAARLRRLRAEPLVPQDPGAAGAPSYAEARRPKRHRDAAGRVYRGPSDLANIETSFSRANDLRDENEVTFLFPDFELRTEPSPLTLKKIAARVRSVYGAEVTVQEPDHGPPTGAPINIEIIGEDLATLGRLARQVRGVVEEVPFTRNVRDDYTEGSPTLGIIVHRQRAAFLGLDSQTIGSALRAAIAGIEVSTYREGDEDYDIIVRLTEEDRHLVSTLRRFMLPAAGGQAVPLRTVASIEYAGGLGEINRIDHDRVVTVQADVDETKTTGATARARAMGLLAGSPEFTPGRLFEPDGPLNPLQIELLAPPLSRALNRLLRTARYAHAPEVYDRLLAAATDAAPKDFRRLELVAEARRDLAAVAPAAAERRGWRRALWQVFGARELPAERRLQINRLVLETAGAPLLARTRSGLEFPAGYRYRFTGEEEHQSEASEFLRWAGVLAVGLIFLILVTQFNSVTFPFIILSAVVLSLAGVFLGLFVYGLPFNIIMTGVGVISLAGVVVNNAIVLIDYTLQLIGRGMARDQAILAAGATRLRPVILTAVTTVLGLVPMATGISVDFHPLLELQLPVVQAASESSQWWMSMAVAVIFGLLVATFLTLFVVPVLFALLDDLRHLAERLGRKLAGRAGRRLQRWRAAYWRFFWRHSRVRPRPGEPGAGDADGAGS